ncbi:hypothetical protein KO481_03425 [Nocardia sp. NEAU-G5]|uniref:FXSXX-COOH protein n=1 Tax=Nocardia albiluteola TaxID=2842303 RepID=A0ABS6ASK3_9NOCA|nr:hypothetical protein [Nocardia albiluteola]MBU3060570.1 hypothetical protein [Nocardia albiluteola]
MTKIDSTHSAHNSEQHQPPTATIQRLFRAPRGATATIGEDALRNPMATVWQRLET